MDPQIQAAIDAAVQAALAAQAAAPPVQVQPPQPVATVFALSPALVNNVALIDYSTTQGAKLYKSAIETLRSEKFDLDTKSLKAFLGSLKDRSRAMGWQVILEIPADAAQDVNVGLRSLLTQYGQISLDQIRAHAEIYINARSRAAQESMLLYECLMNSLSKAGINKVSVWENDYTVNGLPSGPMLLKVILRESHIDTRATVRHIRAKLSKMSSYLPTINNDIPAFNRYVMDLMDDLHARGETTEDLLANLFEAYKSVNDKDFVAFIKRKEEDFDMGADIDTHQLMHLAQNKYKVLVDEKKWTAPSKEEEKIIALEAKISKLTLKPGKPTPGGGSPPGKRSDKPGVSQGGGGKSREKPAWMTKPPNPKDKKKHKVVDKKDYWWCPNHKSWCRHKPEECQGVNAPGTTGNSDHKPSYPKTSYPTPKKNSDSRKLKLTNALEAIHDDEGSDE